MKVLLVNYATPEFRSLQWLNDLTGVRAGFDACRSFGPNDLDEEFRSRHAGTLGERRGGGYWLWKPWIVLQALRDLSEGDLLFYSDSGAHFVASIGPVLEALDRHGLELLILGEGGSEAKFTHREALVRMGCDAPRFTATPQRFASFFLARRSSWSLRFFESYLRWCEDSAVLLDRTGREAPGFVGHRHDQSVFSLLSKQLGVPVPVTSFVHEDLVEGSGQVIHHTRGRVSLGSAVAVLLARGLVHPSDLLLPGEVPRPADSWAPLLRGVRDAATSMETSMDRDPHGR